MHNARNLIITLAFLVIAPAAFGADTSACLGCHSEADFSSMSAGEIIAAVQDPALTPHKKFATISDAELQAIAETLAGS